MRKFAIVLFLSISLAAGFHFFHSSERLTSFAKEVPRDSFALLFVNQIPNSFSFLDNIEWNSVMEVDENDLRRKLEAGLESELLDSVADGVSGLAVALYDLKRKESGEFRIEFMAHVLPKKGAHSGILALIEKVILERFGEDATVRRENSQTVYSGSSTGEYLVMEVSDSGLTISNSVAAWRALIEARSGRSPGLFARPEYREIIEQVDPRADLFLYVRGDGTLIPEFGFSVAKINSENPKTQYFSVDGS